MSSLPELLARNAAFTRSRPATAAQMPTELVYVICCLDPRVEPAAVLGVGLNEALVQRNPGGRVTDEVVDDVALITFMGEFMGLGGGLDVAVIHHTQCGMGLLAVPEFAVAWVERSGAALRDLPERVVTDPEDTVRADVAKLLSSGRLSASVRVSGHVLDLDSGAIRTVVPAAEGVSA